MYKISKVKVSFFNKAVPFSINAKFINYSIRNVETKNRTRTFIVARDISNTRRPLSSTLSLLCATFPASDAIRDSRHTRRANVRRGDRIVE